MAAALIVSSTLAQVPAISSFTPASGGVGTTVTIFGTNFNPVATNNVVWFGSVRANVNTAATNQLTLSVPVGASYSPLTVANNGLIAAANNSFDPSYVGSGSFSTLSFLTQVSLATGTSPIDVKIADMDGDGKPDLIVGNWSDSTISIYRNISTNGTLVAGSFAAPVVFDTGEQPYHIAVADLDGDGKPDVITPNSSDGTITVFRNLGTPGNFTTNSLAAAVDFTIGGAPFQIAVGDLNGDGKPEIVVADSAGTNIFLLANTGSVGVIDTNSFAAPLAIAAGTAANASVVSVAIGDLDGDGLPDLAVAVDFQNIVTILRNTTAPGSTNFSFAAKVDFTTGARPFGGVCLGDLDGDGKLDVVTANYTGGSLSVFHNTGTPGVWTNTSLAAKFDLSIGGLGQALIMADMDGDGKPDLVSVSQNSAAEVFRNIGTNGVLVAGSFAAKVNFAAQAGSAGLAVGDLDGDGRSDLVVANTSANKLSLYRNNNSPAPAISFQPQNQTVLIGANPAFTVTVVSPVPVTYQWYFSNLSGTLGGATNSSLTLTNVQASQAGSYFVVASNLYGSVTSTNAILTVHVPPSITLQPLSQTNNAGDNVTFTGLSNGDPVLGYQWQFNGANISGATDTALTLSNVQSTNAGSYHLVATNLYGTATSSDAIFIVFFPPIIISQPTNQTVNVGATASFRVFALGLPLSYQWYLNPSTLLSGATNASLTLTNVQLSQAGSYFVIVSNALGTATSSNAVLTVNAAPACYPPPSGLIHWWPGEGDATDFVGTAPGTVSGGLTYATAEVGRGFKFNGSDSVITFGTDAGNFGTNDFTIDFWLKTSSGNIKEAVFEKWPTCGNGASFFEMRIGDASIGVGRLNFALGGDGAANFITFESTNAINNGQFHHGALVRSTTNLLFYLDGVSNAAASTPGIINLYNTANFMMGQSVCAGSDGTAPFSGTLDEFDMFNRALTASEVAAIFNIGHLGKCSSYPPYIILQPTNQSVNVGATVTFNVSAGGSPTLAYQWRVNGTNISTGTNSALTLVNVQTNDAGSYSVIVSNAAGTVTSTNALLVVHVPPFIIVPPQDVTTNAGSNATFTVVAGGDQPLSYQWQFNGNGISGASLSTLALNNIQATNAGSYQVVVTSPYGTATSAGAVLTVNYAPIILAQPTNRSVFAGTGVVFTVTAIGRPLFYQWYFNSTNVLSGQTNASLSIPNPQLAQAGTYTVVVSNFLGSVTSSNAVLVVNPPPSCLPAPAGLIHWWRGEGDATDRVGSANGVASGGLTYTNGLDGQAFQFNGTTSLITLGTNTGNFGTNDFTIDFWLKTSSTRSKEAFLEKWVVCGASQSFFEIRIGDPSIGVGRINFALSGDGAANIVTFNSTNAINDGVFHHGALVRNGLALAFYLDGVLNASTTASGIAYLSNNVNCQVGQNVCGSIDGTSPYSGVLDELDMFNRALSASEIAAIYNASFVGKCDTIAPIMTAQPTNQSVVVGTNALFTAAATGTPVLTYQWNFNGTNLLGATNASLTITNAQTTNAGSYFLIVSNAYGTATSTIVSLTLNIPAFITQSPLGLTANAGSNVTFTAVVGGSLPLSYQWRFNGANISGATNLLLTLNNVQNTNSGSYNLVVTNLYGGATSAVAVLVVQTSTLKLVNSSAQAGGTVAVPVQLAALGTENAVSFSLNFDPSILTYTGSTLGGDASGAFLSDNTTQLPAGKVSLSLGLPGGVTFPAGLRSIAFVNFNVAPMTNSTNLTLIFGDQPNPRQIFDTSFNSLPVLSTNGTISLSATVYEGDVSPRTNGDITFGLGDWFQAGRYVAGLDTVNNATEYQRLDCAPRGTLGNGAISIADWVQVGRYAGGQDPLTLAGGPTNDVAFTALVDTNSARIINTAPFSSTGPTNLFSVMLAAQGNENAVGCTLVFDPAIMTFKSATLGSGATGAVLNVNTNQTSSGKLGLALALTVNHTLTAGSLELVRVTFVAATYSSNTTALTLGDSPVKREIASAAAVVLPANYQSNSVAVIGLPIPSLTILPSTTNLLLTWPISFNGFVPESGINFGTNWNPATGALNSNANNFMFLAPLPVTNRIMFRLHHP